MCLPPYQQDCLFSAPHLLEALLSSALSVCITVTTEYRCSSSLIGSTVLHMACRSEAPNTASLLFNSAHSSLSPSPSTQSLPAVSVHPPTSHFPQTQPLPSSHPYLSPPTLDPIGLAPLGHSAGPSMLCPQSTLLPLVLPVTSPCEIVHPVEVACLGNRAYTIPGQSGQASQLASLGLYDTAPVHGMPLYSADAYALMAGSFPQCTTWPRELTHAIDSKATRLNLAKPQATTLPLPAGAALHLGASRLGLSHAGSDEDVSSVDSDPAALVEDALLGELFFAQPEACQVSHRQQQTCCVCVGIKNWSMGFCGWHCVSTAGLLECKSGVDCTWT